MGFCDYVRILINGKDIRFGRSEIKVGYVLSIFGWSLLRMEEDWFFI